LKQQAKEKHQGHRRTRTQDKRKKSKQNEKFVSTQQ